MCFALLLHGGLRVGREQFTRASVDVIARTCELSAKLFLVPAFVEEADNYELEIARFWNLMNGETCNYGCGAFSYSM